MAGLECPQCGAPLPLGATECKYCGEKITPVQSQQTAQPYNQNQYQQPPQGYQQNQYQQTSYPQYENPYGYEVLDPGVNPAWPIKNKVLAGVLAIFFGTFGVHKFYLGKPVQGVLYILFMCTGIPTLLGFIEGLIYVCSNDHNFQVKHQVRLR